MRNLLNHDTERERILEAIGANGFLRLLAPSLQQDLVGCFQAAEVGSGEAIFNEGDSAEEADKFYLIESGTVEMRQVRSRRVIVACSIPTKRCRSLFLSRHKSLSHLFR